MDSRERRVIAESMAQETGGVVSRQMLRAAGITSNHIRNEAAAGRWRPVSRQTVAVHRGELPTTAHWWAAIWEAGHRIAALDGATSLTAWGLTGFKESTIHLSVKHTHDLSSLNGVRLHKVIRRVEGEVCESGVPRVRPAIAAIRAAGWAVSDRQSALILLMTVQQRLCTPAHLLTACNQVMGRRRRRFIRQVVADIALGVQSLGELDFARLCRARGVPEPSRQVVRSGPNGRMYLDVRWDDWALVVEIDGVQHRQGLNLSLDNLSRNAVSLQRDTVLRIDLVGLRLWESAFMDQVAAGLTPSRRVRGIPTHPAAAEYLESGGGVGRR